MKKNLFILTLVMLMLVAGCSGDNTEERMYRIITEYEEFTGVLNSLSESEEMVLLDLRDNRDFENAHCIGSINVPFDDEGAWLLKCIEENNWKNKTIYLICGGGKRSGDAFNLLLEHEIPRVVYVSFGYGEYTESQGYENSEGADVCDCYQQ